MLTSILCIFAVCLTCMIAAQSIPNEETPPNIVFILMDDLGWMDVSFNGGQFPTSNIDSLKQNSIELTRHYIHLMCSPSRTQFLTGRYAMRQGIGKMLPWDYTEIGGIPIGQPTIASWLKVGGNYSTYAVGKWHCGYACDALLPTQRGFDHFFGFYQGAIHYDTLKYIDIKFGDSDHYDFWDDTEEYIYNNSTTINSMRLYRDKIIEYIEAESAKDMENKSPFYMYIPLQTIHGPLNSVHTYQSQCNEILQNESLARRNKYCQNILLTDDIVGEIMQSLKYNHLWNSTLLIFTTDNGADISNKGCNFPLRGTKGTQFDGNTRVIALIGGGVIPYEQYGTVRDSLFSSLDWTPTLLHFAGIYDKIRDDDITWDGIDQYNLLMYPENIETERDHIVFNIGLSNLESATIVFKDEIDGHLYKYIAQDESVDQWIYKREDGWCIPDENGDWNVIDDNDISLAQPIDNKYLFDLTNDISEKTNLLQLSNNNELINYAKSILSNYTQHPLYSQHLPFLWTRLPIGDPENFGQGSFVAPFFTDFQYHKHLQNGFAQIEQEDVTAFTPHLKRLYVEKWEAPQYLQQETETPIIYVGNAFGNNIYYAIVISVIVISIFVLIFLIIRSKYFINTVRFYKDGYVPINHANTNMI